VKDLVGNLNDIYSYYVPPRDSNWKERKSKDTKNSDLYVPVLKTNSLSVPSLGFELKDQIVAG
jgi:hypothetical protein